MRQARAVGQEMGQCGCLKVGVKSGCLCGKHLAECGRPVEQTIVNQHSQQGGRHCLGARADVNLVLHLHGRGRSELANARCADSRGRNSLDDAADHSGQVILVANLLEHLSELDVGTDR